MTAPAAMPSEAPVELWRGDRKVTIYRDVVIRVWGSNCAYEMSDEPRTLESVNAAVEWLFAPILAEKERLERNRDMWKGQCERQAEALRQNAIAFQGKCLDLDAAEAALAAERERADMAVRQMIKQNERLAAIRAQIAAPGAAMEARDGH